MGAAFFLVHPLVVEPVAWISGLKDVGAMFFGLLGVSIALAGRWSVVTRHGLAFLCYGLSIMTKPSGVIFPLLAGILFILSDKKWLHQLTSDDKVSHDREKSKAIDQSHVLDHPRLSHRGLWHAVIGSVIVSPIIFFSMYLQPAVQMQEHVVWWKRPIIALDAVAFYASKMLVPWELLPDYARRPSVVLDGEFLGSVAEGMVVILMPWILLKRRPIAAFGLVMGSVALMPNLGLIPFAFQDHSTVADRYAYAALFGLSVVIAWVARDQRWRLCLFLPLAFLALMSYRQVGYWQDQGTLFRHVLDINPQSVVALDGLGVEDYRAGNMARAEDYFRRALSINPRTSRSWFNVGSVLWVKGDKSGATQALETSLKLDPNHPDTLNNLGFIYAATGKDKAAESLFRRALYVNHLDLDARYNLAQLLYKKGLVEESTSLLEEALVINPRFKDKYFPK
jgi:lipoprotein NlpI